MSKLQIAAADLHMGLPIYCTNGEKIGNLRFTIANLEPPFEVQQIVIDRGTSIYRNLSVPAEVIVSTDNSGIRLSITEEELAQYPEFVESRWFSFQQREYSMQQPVKTGKRRPSAPNRQPRYPSQRGGQSRI